MKKVVLLSLSLIFVLVVGANAAVFLVTPDADTDCSDACCTIQSALTAAEGNNEENTLRLASGTHSILTPLLYQPVANNHSLTIEGAGADATILDGGGLVQILHIDTTGIPDDADADVAITGMGFINAMDPESHNPEGTSGVYFASNLADITFQYSDPAVPLYLHTGGIVTITSTGDIDILSGSEIVANSMMFTSESGGISFDDLASLNGELILETSLFSPVHIDNPILIGNSSEVSIFLNSEAVGVDISASTGSITLANGKVGVVEGNTITLDGAHLFDRPDEIVSYHWVQTETGNISIMLSDSSAVRPTFVGANVVTDGAGPAGAAFECTAQYSNGSQAVKGVEIEIADNGISGLPGGVIPFVSINNQAMGVAVQQGGGITKLISLDPVDIIDEVHKPTDLPFGLFDFEIKVDNPGDEVRVAFYLPEPAPAGYKWFKYKTNGGWSDFSGNAVFNANRNLVTLTLVDGGAGDDDGVANGLIRDPSGLGSAGASGGGGCFISAAAW